MALANVHGSPVGMKYYFGYTGMTLTDYDYFFFEKNMFGDIIGVYEQNGIKVLGFTYDAWGTTTQPSMQAETIIISFHRL